MNGPRRAAAFCQLLRDAFARRPTATCYDRLAPRYDTLFGPAQLRHARAMADRLSRSDAPFDRALDLGAGTGLLTALLAPFCVETIALDYSAPMLREARRHTSDPHIAFVRGDMRTLPFNDDAFDLVTCLGAYSHVEGAGMEDFLEEVRRVLAPGGLLAIGLTPMPWRMGLFSRSPLEPTRLDRAATQAYNALMRRLGIDEHRHPDTAARLTTALSASGFSVSSQSLETLGLVLGRGDCHAR